MCLFPNTYFLFQIEPGPCCHATLGFKVNSDLEKVTLLKQDVVDAIYELGPGMEQSINAL